MAGRIRRALRVLFGKSRPGHLVVQSIVVTGQVDQRSVEQLKMESRRSLPFHYTGLVAPAMGQIQGNIVKVEPGNDGR